MDGVEFLVELCIAVGIINLIVIVVLLFLVLGISATVSKHNDLIAFIHKRAKIAERREDSMIDAQRAKNKRK
tara:strand:- start:173 stop:388 length:216 start_codon:yes stop_codon:yes gene_type:complete